MIESDRVGEDGVSVSFSGALYSHLHPIFCSLNSRPIIITSTFSTSCIICLIFVIFDI